MSTFANDHERWADSLGAWLLGALPADEAEGFREHLAACPVCQEDAASLQVAADALPIAVTPHAPPPALKERLMAIVESEAAPAPAPAAPPRRERRPWLPRLSLRPALAIGLAALALGVAGGVLGSRALEDGARTISAKVEGSGRATLEIEDGRARLVAARLPAPPAGRVYQVWLDRGGPAPEPTDALFSTRGDGSASVDVPGSLDGVRAVMVTDEPRGGSEEPTGKLLLSAST